MAQDENVVKLKLPVRSLKLVCSECGAGGEMNCDCGVSFVREANATRKSDQVVEALQDPANAGKSDRSLATELGVDHKTVGAARQSTGEFSPVPEKRVGLDGKARSMPTPKLDTTPARAEAKEVIRAYKAEHGVYPSAAEAGKVAGKSRIVIEPALAAVKAEDKTSPTITTFTKGQDQQIEARLKVRQAELERTFDARVTAENQKQIASLFPDLEKIRDDAKRAEKMYLGLIEKQAVLKEAEYMDILRACHPDNSAGKDVRERAFITLNAKKLQLTGKK
jgi:hypothetical protein